MSSATIASVSRRARCSAITVTVLLAGFAGMRAPPATAQDTSIDTARFVTGLRFPVTDTASLFEHQLDSALVIRVYRQSDARARHMGWWVAVFRQPVEDGSLFNLLYHSRYWHGPYPTDLFAWHWGQRRFPDERILPVYGSPYEIRVQCLGCETEGQGANVRFTRGIVVVAWRRLARPYHGPE